ncbi:hypothetical protein ACFL0H_05150 [Thermodesulfobacteriota bacterium]
MDQKTDLKEISSKIALLKSEAQGLKKMAENFPALNRNTERILASIKMLEINIPDSFEYRD